MPGQRDGPKSDITKQQPSGLSDLESTMINLEHMVHISLSEALDIGCIQM